MKRINQLTLAAVLSAVLMPSVALACACGCGIFDVGTGTMLPTDTGGEVWLAYDFMNQTQNWQGSSPSPSYNNFDKVLRTDFFTAGVQYMFNRSWGAEAEIPYWDRTFKTNPTNIPDQGTQVFNHSDIGDVRLKGIYSGFEDDMSTGMTFGLKLASGNFTYPNFDRDSSIGTGSTDLLLGAYHMGDMSNLMGGLPFDWFANGQLDMPFLTQQNYRPGDEFDMALGSYYNGFDFGSSGKIAPLLQILGSIREHDVGMNANPPVDGMNQSGYQRVFISPGVEYDIDAVKLYTDVELPVWQHFNGDQLAAPFLLKVVIGYNF